MKLFVVKSYAILIDIYGRRSDANRRVAVENRIVKDNMKLESQLQSIKYYIENSHNCPVKKRQSDVKYNRKYKVFYVLSSFVDVLDYKDCVKQTHVGYCKKFNKTPRPLYHSKIEIVEKELL